MITDCFHSTILKAGIWSNSSFWDENSGGGGKIFRGAILNAGIRRRDAESAAGSVSVVRGIVPFGYDR
jgi:hypothetical protein